MKKKKIVSIKTEVTEEVMVVKIKPSRHQHGLHRVNNAQTVVSAGGGGRRYVEARKALVPTKRQISIEMSAQVDDSEK